MKKKTPTQADQNIVASVKAEMDKPRLTESVREDEREQAAKDRPER